MNVKAYKEFLFTGTLLGVTLAVESMRRGEFSRFIASPDYAYRKMGCPPRVPPDATSTNLRKQTN